MERTKRKRAPIIAYYSREGDFGHLLDEGSVSEMMDTARENLELPKDASLRLSWMHDGHSMKLKTERDFQCFAEYARSVSSAVVQVAVASPGTSVSAPILPATLATRQEEPDAVIVPRVKRRKMTTSAPIVQDEPLDALGLDVAPPSVEVEVPEIVPETKKARKSAKLKGSSITITNSEPSTSKEAVVPVAAKEPVESEASPTEGKIGKKRRKAAPEVPSTASARAPPTTPHLDLNELAPKPKKGKKAKASNEVSAITAVRESPTTGGPNIGPAVVESDASLIKKKRSHSRGRKSHGLVASIATASNVQGDIIPSLPTPASDVPPCISESVDDEAFAVTAIREDVASGKTKKKKKKSKGQALSPSEHSASSPLEVSPAQDADLSVSQARPKAARKSQAPAAQTQLAHAASSPTLSDLIPRAEEPPTSESLSTAVTSSKIVAKPKPRKAKSSVMDDDWTCPICDGKFHLRHACPIVVAGPDALESRIAEMRRMKGKSWPFKFFEELEAIVTARRGKAPVTTPAIVAAGVSQTKKPALPSKPALVVEEVVVQSHPHTSTQTRTRKTVVGQKLGLITGKGASSAHSSKLPLIPASKPTTRVTLPPSGSHISEVTVESRDEGSSSESSESDSDNDNPPPRTQAKTRNGPRLPLVSSEESSEDEDEDEDADVEEVAPPPPRQDFHREQAEEPPDVQVSEREDEQEEEQPPPSSQPRRTVSDDESDEDTSPDGEELQVQVVPPSAMSPKPPLRASTVDPKASDEETPPPPKRKPATALPRIPAFRDEDELDSFLRPAPRLSQGILTGVNYYDDDEDGTDSDDSGSVAQLEEEEEPQERQRGSRRAVTRSSSDEEAGSIGSAGTDDGMDVDRPAGIPPVTQGPNVKVTSMRSEPGSPNAASVVSESSDEEPNVGEGVELGKVHSEKSAVPAQVEDASTVGDGDVSMEDSAELSTEVAPPASREVLDNDHLSNHSGFSKLAEESDAPARSSSLARENAISAALGDVDPIDAGTGAITPPVPLTQPPLDLSNVSEIPETQESLPLPSSLDPALAPSSQGPIAGAVAQSTSALIRPKRSLRMKQLAGRPASPIAEVEDTPDPIDSFEGGSAPGPPDDDPIEADPSGAIKSQLSPSKTKGMRNRKGLLAPPDSLEPSSVLIDPLNLPEPASPPLSSVAPPASQVVESPPRRRVGRPRKNPLPEESVVSESISVPLRRTIIVKKQPIYKPDQLQSNSSASAPPLPTAAAPSSSPSDSKVPKRRGRPPLPQEEKDRRAAAKQALKEQKERIRATKKAEKAEKTQGQGSRSGASASQSRSQARASEHSESEEEQEPDEAEDPPSQVNGANHLNQSLATWNILVPEVDGDHDAETTSQVDQLQSSLAGSRNASPSVRPRPRPEAADSVSAAPGNRKSSPAVEDPTPVDEEPEKSPSIVPATQQTQVSSQSAGQRASKLSQRSLPNPASTPVASQRPLFLANVTQSQWPRFGYDSQLKIQKGPTQSDDESDDNQPANIPSDGLFTQSTRRNPAPPLIMPRASQKAFPPMPSLSAISAKRDSYFSSPVVTPNGYERQLAQATTRAFGSSQVPQAPSDDDDEEEEEEESSGSSSNEEPKSHIPKDRKAGLSMPPKSRRKSALKAFARTR